MLRHQAVTYSDTCRYNLMFRHQRAALTVCSMITTAAGAQVRWSLRQRAVPAAPDAPDAPAVAAVPDAPAVADVPDIAGVAALICVCVLELF